MLLYTVVGQAAQMRASEVLSPDQLLQKLAESDLGVINRCVVSTLRNLELLTGLGVRGVG
jgi:hypothetical protein